MANVSENGLQISDFLVVQLQIIRLSHGQQVRAISHVRQLIHLSLANGQAEF